jgi:hypothetical protein
MTIRILCPEGHPVRIEASKLGGVVVCPQCFTSFLSEPDLAPSWHARKATSKSSRSRDDDDDDDDEDDEDDEDEKPQRKKKAAKEDDDDEEDEDEEEEEKEPEAPIEWTSRKRQLNACSNGLVAMMVGCYFMAGFAGFAALWIDIFEIDIFGDKGLWAIWLFFWSTEPLMYLAVAAFTGGMVFNLAVPAKAEGRGALIGGLVFAGVFFFLGLIIVLTLLGWLLSDPARQENFVRLQVGASIICFILCMVSAQAYLAKLMIFMKMHLESSQPITNFGFVFLCFAGMIALAFLSPMLKSNIGDWMCYVVAFAADICAGVAIRTLIVHAFLLIKLRKAIAKYIRDE